MKANKKTLNLFSTISLCVAIVLAVTEFILISFSIVTPSRLENAIWVFGFLCWVAIYVIQQRRLGKTEELNESIYQKYNNLYQSYNKLSDSCDRVLDIADNFRKINEEVIALSEEILNRHSDLIEVLSKINTDKQFAELINEYDLSSYEEKLTRIDNQNNQNI